VKTRGLTNETKKGKTFFSKNEYEKMRGKTTITEKNVHGSVLLFNKVFVVVHSCGTVTTKNSPPGEDQRIEK
jgi:hypothetical protein